MEENDGFPFAFAVRDGLRLTIPVCPFCGRAHRHGTGNQPGPWLRLTHCIGSPIGQHYRIVEAEPALTAPAKRAA